MEELELGKNVSRQLLALPRTPGPRRGSVSEDDSLGGGGQGSLPGGATIEAAIALLSGLRAVDPEMTVQMAQCFLAIAARPGMTVKEMAEIAEVEDSTASRNAGMLGRYGRGQKEGYRVVEFHDDPNDRRVRRLELTDKGRRVLKGALRRMQEVVLGSR
jgi:DNA-binding MarR family transcriptional regulator